MPTVTDSKNLLTDTEANRIQVTPNGAQIFRDTTSGMTFIGDGSTAGGRAMDIRPNSSTITTKHKLINIT